MLDEGERYVEPLDSSGVSESHCIESSDGQRRVLKVLRLADVDRWKAVELFEREADVLQKLDHPGIPTYLDFRTDIREPEASADAGAVTLTVRREWVPGKPLQPRLDPSKLGDFLAETLDILAYLHSQNPPVVHRDVTPEHWIESPGGELTLVGFGGIQSLLPQTRGGSTFVGTRGYMPVEQMMGRAVPASDLFGLAATAFQLVTDQHPSPVVRSDESEALRTHLEAAGVDAEHTSLLESMLQPKPGDRPPDAQAAKRRLDEAASLIKASEVELTLVDTPPPDGVNAQIDTEGASLSVAREGYNISTGWWFYFVFLIAISAINSVSLLIELSLEKVLPLAFGAVLSLALGLKAFYFGPDPDLLFLKGQTLQKPGRLWWLSGEWDLREIDAVDWRRDEDDRSYYQVDIEVDGSTHTVASRLSRPRAQWLTDFLQRLRTRRLSE